MDFVRLADNLYQHFNEMVKDVEHMFEVDVDKNEMYDLYLDSFPAGTNEIYRKRREYDCSICRQFIRQIGNVVVIKDNKVTTIWDFKNNEYQQVLDAMSAFIKSHAVSDVYISTFRNIGTAENHEQLDDGTIIKYNHFHVELPGRFIKGMDKEQIKAGYRDTRNVFKRSLDELSMDSIDTVLELIYSNTLYKGEEWKVALEAFKKHKKAYDGLDESDKENYAWEQSVKAGSAMGRIRNHSIGTLLVNISDGMELDEAVCKYEQIVAPQNYKRPKAIYTKKMLEDAKKTITGLGYMDSLPRRFANLDDITVNNILFSNRDVQDRIQGAGGIFDELEKDASISPKKFSKVEEIPAADFISSVLPTAKEVEVYVEGRHKKNFVSMTAPCDREAKTMFKWNNALGWAYTGNIADSDIKENVKYAGGNVSGVLRFSIQWNEGGHDNSDLDAHCKEPDGNEIYYCNCRAPGISRCGGQLDVDIVNPKTQMPGRPAVENITWADKAGMKPGAYRFYVHQFNADNSQGFKAEIEMDGEVHSFEYNTSLRHKENIEVATVIMDDKGNFTIKPALPEASGGTVWNVGLNQFVPVSVVSYSPNYFDEQEGIGHRHLFFFLKDCINDEEPNGYYNEFLKNELMGHKKVFEALGAKCHVADAEDQLSGIGFSMTKRAELIVKVKGATERVMRIKF